MQEQRAYGNSYWAAAARHMSLCRLDDCQHSQPLLCDVPHFHVPLLTSYRDPSLYTPVYMYPTYRPWWIGDHLHNPF
jgi:hypothetical protein